jgi:hypothetical protein
MVAQRHKMKNHSPGRYRSYSGSGWLSVSIALLLALSEGTFAQNLVNHGKITNTGILRVKNQAIGVTDTLNGTFELFGANQNVPATQYGNLSLTGTGNYTAAGDATVTKILTIAPAVTLQVPLTSMITLGSSSGRLTENGYLSGKIKKTVDLSAASPDTTFGGIGMSISWNGANPGLTTVTRTSGSSVPGNGKQSIQRYFDVSTTVSSNLNATLKFTYAGTELAGQNPSALELWRSPDNGTTWRRERSNRNGTVITKAGLQSFGRWTVADTNNLLGLASYEWEADSIRLLAGNNQTSRVKRLLDTAFVARVVDAYGQPVVGQNVSFALSQKPLNSVGDSLTIVSAATDSLGLVQTVLKLGSVKGDYYVQATVPGVPTALTKFHAFARPAASILNAFPLASTSDSVRSQVGPITVKAMDSTGAVIQGVQINFAVSNAPDTVGAYQLSNATVSTDTGGLASTTLKLGTKIGPYLVTATSPDVDPPVTRQFLINATPGAVASVNYFGGGVDTITALKMFSVQVLDSYKNPRRGDTVQFALSNKPSGATFDSLFTAIAVTDSNGYAATTLRVGQKAGNYVVSALLKGYPQFSNLFTTSAHSLVAANMLAATTTYSDTIGAVLQPMKVSVTDKYDNPVLGTNVAFAVTQRPDTAAGGSLTAASVQTDSTLGQASTVFTAGDKVGTYTIRATAGTLAQNFNAQITAGKPAQLLAAGVYQSKPILQQVDSVLSVTLTDRKANPLANLPVQFALIQKPTGAVGENLGTTKTTTNPQGVGSTGFKVGNKVGLYVVLAFSDSLKGVAKAFTVNALNSAAFALDSVGGQYQRKAILSTLDTAFVVSVTDKGGNPVPGVVVKFAITGWPVGTTLDSLTRASDTANASGQASTYLRFGTRVGSYVVTATAPSLPNLSRRFLANATNGSAFAMLKVRGDRQLAVPYTTLDSAFVVNVRDIGNNPIPGLAVQFKITQIPLPETVGQALSDTNVVTDSVGQASARLTLGSEVGLYAVSANANGLPPTTFSTTSYLLVGDANIDASINVGDLTAIIDHILGKLILTGSDSAAADVNSDGVIDIRDAIMMRDRVLTGNWSQRVPDSLFALSRPSSSKQMSGVPRGAAHIAADTTGSYLVTLGSYLEVTQNGMRLNLSSNQPIKGLQYIIHMKNPPMIQKPDVIYDRGKMMTVLVFRTDTTLRLIAYNLNNTPIQPGEGAIFRLPIPASKAADIDTSKSELIVSEGVTNRALEMPFISVRQAAPGAYPTTYKLEQNYPNPFNGSTIIYYEVPDVAGRLAHVTLQVFNILGEKVKTLVKEDKEPGRYFARWDGSGDGGQKVASGVYIYRLVWKDNQNAKKMLLIK